ncbi:hypothetical protein D3C87_1725250 [compost metagenome]
MLAKNPPTIDVAVIKHDDIRAFEAGQIASCGLPSIIVWLRSYDELRFGISVSKGPDH